MSHINQSSLSRMQALLAKARAAKILEHGSEATEVVPTPSETIHEIPAEETIHLITISSIGIGYISITTFHISHIPWYSRDLSVIMVQDIQFRYLNHFQENGKKD